MIQRLFIFLIILFLIYWTSVNAQDTSCGIVWEPPVQLSPDTLYAGPMPITSQGDTIYLTWSGNRALEFPYVRSVDGGKTLEPMREIAPDSVGRVGLCYLLNGGKRLHAFFDATKTGGNPVYLYHMYSDDRGTTWSSPVRLTDSLQYIGGTILGDTLVLITSTVSNPWPRLTVSTDGGTTWKVSDSLFNPGTGTTIALTRSTLHMVKGYLFDSSGYHSLGVIQYRKSTNLGVTWSDSIPLSTVNSISLALNPYMAAHDDGDSSRVVVVWGRQQNELWGKISNDNGMTFSHEFRIDQRPAGFLQVAAVWGKRIAVIWTDGLPDGGSVIAYSSDGINWCPPYQLSNGIIPMVTISPSAVHVVWEEVRLPKGNFVVMYSRGVFLPTGVHDEINRLPERIYLDQNYPNPFNPVTTIRYEVRGSGFVTLKVYDLFGREVTTLINEKKEAGTYDVEWKSDGFASGVYYYRITANNGGNGLIAETKKMLLLK